MSKYIFLLDSTDWRGKKDVPTLIESYNKNDLKLDEFITHRMGLDKVNDAFDLMRQSKRYSLFKMKYIFVILLVKLKMYKLRLTFLIIEWIFPFCFV